MNVIDSVRIVSDYYSKNMAKVDEASAKISSGEGDIAENATKLSSAKNEVEVSMRLLKMCNESSKDVLNLIQ